MTAIASRNVVSVPVALPPKGIAGGGGGGAAGLSPADLAELAAAFQTVTARLQATHEALTAEVAQLKGELAAANAQVERSRRLAALGEMAAGIAHEVRNPLGSIRLYAKILRDDLADRPEQAATAEKIGGAVTRLDAVVGDVLSFAREVRTRPVAVDADELLASALAAARGDGPEWEGVGVEVSARAGSVVCDAGLVQQALVNLVRNAVEAMHEACSPARRLTLSARRRVVRTPAGKAPMVVLSVRDSGPGIAAGVVERIFNPFFTTRAAGTGLGLAIVSRIADAHGGRIGVRNAEGGGAVAELLLPAGCGGAGQGRGSEGVSRS